jgi:hypothetical protein
MFEQGSAVEKAIRRGSFRRRDFIPFLPVTAVLQEQA